MYTLVHSAPPEYVLIYTHYNLTTYPILAHTYPPVHVYTYKKHVDNFWG